MRQALLLYAAQACAWVRHTPTKRITAPRAAPQGWEDLSNGKGACCVRRLTPPRGGPKPPPGAECSVRWTAWLAEKQGTWWCRGERIGALQPNSTLEFTLGGGSGEATRAWDACVATMVPQDRVEILAGPGRAFGAGSPLFGEATAEASLPPSRAPPTRQQHPDTASKYEKESRAAAAP